VRTDKHTETDRQTCSSQYPRCLTGDGVKMAEYRGRQGLTFIIMTNQSKCRCYINVLFVLYCRDIYQQHLWYGFSAIGRLCFRTMNSNEMHTFAQIIGTYSFTYQARSNSWVNVIGHTSRSQEELKVKKIGSVRPRVGVSFFWYIVSIGIKIARRI